MGDPFLGQVKGLLGECGLAVELTEVDIVAHRRGIWSGTGAFWSEVPTTDPKVIDRCLDIARNQSAVTKLPNGTPGWVFVLLAEHKPISSYFGKWFKYANVYADPDPDSDRTVFLFRNGGAECPPLRAESLATAQYGQSVFGTTRPKALDLFSGSHSVGKVLHRLGFDVVSVDISAGPTDDGYASFDHHHSDIMKWDFSRYEPHSFLLVTASPVCTWWSSLRKTIVGRKRQLSEIESLGKPMVDRLLQILEHLKPSLYWIENPASSEMKDYLKLPSGTASYCHYSDWGFQKNTRIFNNWGWEGGRMCKKDCSNLKPDGTHKARVGLRHDRTQQRGVERPAAIPPLLVHELVLSALRSLPEEVLAQYCV